MTSFLSKSVSKRNQVLMAIVIMLAISALAQAASVISVSRSERNLDAGFVVPEICPEPIASGLLTAAGQKVVATTTGKKATPLLKAARGEKRVSVSTAAYVTGEEQAAMLTIGTGWSAATSCRSPLIEAWFVGGSGAVESQSGLVLINQAASSATAEVTAWTPSGPASASTVTVPALGSTRISLDRYAAASIVTRVRALSGRLGMYLLDRRARGLTVLGGDYVAAQPAPDRKVVLLGLSGERSNQLRLLVPGTQDAVVRIDAAFGTDRFTPAGLDSLQVKAGKVVEIPLNFKNSTGLGALVIDSDVPLVAGIYTPLLQANRQKDFAWIAPSSPLASSAFALGSPSSTLLFFNDGPTVAVSVSDTAGRSKPSINVDQLRAVALKSSLRISTSANLYAAQLFSGKTYVSVIPINPLQRAQKRVAPIPDLGVLAPR